MTDHDAAVSTPLGFLEALALATGGCAGHERFIFCGFHGDPHSAPTHAWRPLAWRPGDPLPISPQRTNGYVAISTFRRAPDNTWRRRVDLFASGRALMVDDVGTKVDRRLVERVPPTVRVETSPGNEQWWYWLAEPAQNAEQFGAVIRAFIDQRLLAPDPGMNGVNRVGRVPGFINGKRAHGAFRVRVLEHDAAALFTTAELARAFGLRPRTRRPPIIPQGDRSDRVETFLAIYALLARWGVVRQSSNLAGWHDVECPWRDQHTARAGTGAAIREPSADNEWVGAFQCHHGHCADKTWRDLEDWAVGMAADELEAAAERGDDDRTNEHSREVARTRVRR